MVDTTDKVAGGSVGEGIGDLVLVWKGASVTDGVSIIVEVLGIADTLFVLQEPKTTTNTDTTQNINQLQKWDLLIPSTFRKMTQPPNELRIDAAKRDKVQGTEWVPPHQSELNEAARSRTQTCWKLKHKDNAEEPNPIMKSTNQ